MKYVCSLATAQLPVGKQKEKIRNRVRHKEKIRLEQELTRLSREPITVLPPGVAGTHSKAIQDDINNNPGRKIRMMVLQKTKINKN